MIIGLVYAKVTLTLLDELLKSVRAGLVCMNNFLRGLKVIINGSLKFEGQVEGDR